MSNEQRPNCHSHVFSFNPSQWQANPPCPFCTLKLPDSLAQHRVLSTSKADSFNLKGNLCLIQWLSPPNEKIKYLTIFSIVLLLCFELGCILWCFSCSEMMNIPFKPTQCYLQMNLKRNKIAQG